MKTALGLMSGTSMDGIDIALVRTDGKFNIEFGPTTAVEYSSKHRSMIERGLEDALEIRERNQRPKGLAELEQLITRSHVQAVHSFLQEHRLGPSQIDLIGFHGQTVLHRPQDALTVQLGDGDLLAEETGIDVVYDMRAQDMTVGGQGAPLVPVFHQALAQTMDVAPPVCFVNIGGISNISFIDDSELLAFDSGPGNALIDQWVQEKAGVPFDAGGKIASEGNVIPDVVERYLASPFFDRAGPKSLDRNDFPKLTDFNIELSDGARTLARVTAESILKSADHLPTRPKTWVICGGGRLNETIMKDLACLATRQGARVVSSDSVGLQGDMIEAQAFAYLAVRSQLGLPLTFPGTTGCRKPITGGVLARAN